MSIPTTCRAAVVGNEGPDFSIKIADVKVPEPSPDEVLIRLKTSGLCYSDLHYMLNDTPAPRMGSFGVTTAGHEGCGVVVKVGCQVPNFQIGDRAGVKPIWSTCGTCELCLGDNETHCAKKRNTGLAVTGTFQHYILADARHAIRIPEGIPDDLAATLMCSGATAFRSVKSASLPPGSDVVVLGGGGGVGVQVVQIAKLLGLRPIVVDIGDAKRELSLSMGADAFVDIQQADDAVAEVLRLTNGGAHGVFVTAPPAYRTALHYVGNRVGAVVMCIGLPPAGSGQNILANPSLLILKHLTIKGSLVGTREDTNTVLKFAQRGLIKTNCQVVSLEQLPEMVQLMKEGKATRKIVVDFDL
ncbi:chaperonin 10-like protein [Ilyonectria destructans]|nr:chaperonin 10-like protein [Ilyonectria destructans]